MDSKPQRPAQPANRRTYFLRIPFMLFIAAVITLASIHPVAARPGNAPPPVLVGGSKITLSTDVSDGAFAWGDYDNDGDLDILATGADIDNTGKTTIFVNSGSGFTERSSGMAQVQFSSAVWGDYDNDGFLDVLLTGQLRVEGGSTIIGFAGLYRNISSGGGRAFSLRQSFPNIYQGSGTFADYDNDGRVDILLTGYTDNGVPFSRLYWNNGNTSGTVFTTTEGDGSSTPSVTALGASTAAWADYNRDGFIDFAISGKTAANEPRTLVYRNNAGASFTVTTLTGVWGGTVTFFDYDLDRYLDLLVTGNTGTNISPNIQPKTILYRSPSFSEVPSTGLPDIWSSTVSVGDYDNDGDADVALGGKTLTLLPNRVYQNNRNGTFTNVNAGLPDRAGTMMAWGDYDGDNTLDLALSGVSEYDPGTGQDNYVTYLYPNEPPAANSVPTMPAMEAACWNAANQRLTLIWRNSTDGTASGNSLSYNVRVGTAVDGQNILNPSSDPITGDHRLPSMGTWRASLPLGNLYPDASRSAAILRSPPSGVYNWYWSVQAIDASYVGGPFDNTTGRVINMGTTVAANDSFSILDNAVNVPLNLLTNDNDNGGASTLAVYSYSNPSHGQLRRDTTNPNILLYTPPEPYIWAEDATFTYYAIRTDSLYCTRATVTIKVSQFNNPPTGITLTPQVVPDGAPSGTLVGTLATIDPDVNQSFTYTLPSSPSYPDNAAFRIPAGTNQLVTNTSMDYDTKNTYQILVRSTENPPYNLSVDQVLTVTVVPNQAPTDIQITPSPATVMEHQPVGTIVGALSTEDPDASDTFTYSFAPDDTAFDNGSFRIIVNQDGAFLTTRAVFDHNTRETYQVHIRSTDRAGLIVEKTIPITISPSMPLLSALSSLPVSMSEDGVDSYNKADPFHLKMSAEDAGVGEVLTWSIAQQAAHGTAAASGTTNSKESKDIQYTPTAHWNSAGGRGNDSFVVRVTDPWGNYNEMTVTVNVAAVNDPPTFNAIGDRTFLVGSGRQAIAITGIKPGPLYETGQLVTLSAQCPEMNPCDAAGISNLVITDVQANGTATLYLTVGTMPGEYLVVIAARDGQPLQNTSSRSFKVTVVPVANRFYLPIMQKN